MNFPLRRPGSDLLRCVTATGLLVSLGTVAPPANATVYTWTGTGTTTTPTGGNWSNGFSGGSPLSATTTELDFASNANYTSTNNISTPFDVNILTFFTGSNSGTTDVPTVAGDQIQFVLNGATTPVINQNDASNAAISAPIDFEVPLTVQGSGAGILTLSGTLSGAGSLTKTNTAQVTITRTNSYTGGTIINSTGGIVVTDASNALGTGTVSLGSGSTTGPKLSLNGAAGFTYANDLTVVSNSAIEADYAATISGPGTVASTIAAGALLTLQTGGAAADIGTITNSIGGSGSLQRANNQAGGWILSGNNSYSGTTTVTAGLLAITGTTSGQGNYSVGGAASFAGTLAGSGTIGLAAGAKLSVVGFTGSTAGNAVLEPTNAATPTASSIGMLTVVSAGAGSSVALGSLSTLSIAVGSSSSSSELVVGSLTQAVALTLTSTNTLALTGTFDGSNYTIAHAFGAQTGTFANLIVNGTTEPSASTFSANGFTYNVDYGVADAVGGTDIELVAMTVPEPSAFAGILTLLAIGGLYCRARARLGRLA